MFAAEEESRSRPLGDSGIPGHPRALPAKFSWSLSGVCFSCCEGDQHLQVPRRSWTDLAHNGKKIRLGFLNIWLEVFFHWLLCNVSFLYNDRTAPPDDSSPRSPGGRGKLIVGELTRYITSVYFIFTVGLLFPPVKYIPYVSVSACFWFWKCTI